MKITFNEKIERFAALLEMAGYEDALALVFDELAPLVKKKRVSLLEAADTYIGHPGDNEQDTSEYQLHQALLKIDLKDLRFLEI